MRRIITIAAFLGALACTRATAPPAGATEPRPLQSNASSPSVTLPDGAVIHVEVVADDELRAQGLMYRDELRPDRGMLFFFPGDGAYSFWMKNTRIPLDIIWIDANRTVVDVKHDAPPCVDDPCPSYHPAGPARYVLELAAGVARTHGLEAGDALQFANVDSVVVR